LIQTKIIYSILIICCIFGALYLILINNLNIDESKTIPRFVSTWEMGKGSEYESTIKYYIDNYDDDYQLLVILMPEKTQAINNNLLHVKIIDTEKNIALKSILYLTDDYIIQHNDDDDNIRSYINILKNTIFSKQDINSRQKYLIDNSSWGKTFVGKLTPSLNVVNDIVELTFGNLNTFKVNYEIGSHYNAFFIVDNIPIPIMAKYYDIDGNVQYSYNLLSFDMTYEPLYNLYTFTSNHSANSIISLLHLHHK